MAAISVMQIVKESLSEIKKRQLLLTPENYTEVYNEISKKYGYTTEEKQKIQKYISRLAGDHKNQASCVRINTIDEFVAFVTARLNRSSGASVNLEDENYKSLKAFTRRVLQASSMLHNKRVKSMAEEASQALNKKCECLKFDELREKWFDFVSEYNDDYLNFLKHYGVKGTSDLKTMVDELEKFLTLHGENPDLGSMAELVIMMLSPSISKEIDSDIQSMVSIIRKDPSCLNKDDVKSNLKQLVNKRIEADKGEISQKILILNGVLENIGERLSELANTTHASSKKVKDIKTNIKDIKFDAASFEEVRDTLFNIATALELESSELGKEMNDKQATISDLQNRVATLEKELESAKLESKEDFLTKTANKRALMAELKKMDEGYKRYGTDYSLCFLDIDFFKKINDTYGHEAGDVILSTVASIFRKYSRKVDFVGRYGGEEFVILLPSTTLNDAVRFADKLRTIIENFKFIYKNERIHVTLSSGVSTRSLNLNDTTTLENADKMLYSAKQNGRNQVMPKVINK